MNSIARLTIGMSMGEDDSVDLAETVLREELEGGREKRFPTINEDRPVYDPKGEVESKDSHEKLVEGQSHRSQQEVTRTKTARIDSVWWRGLLVVVPK